MFVAPFGLTSPETRDAPDAAELAEEALLWMIERSKGLQYRHRRRRRPPEPRIGRVAGGL